VSRPRVRPMPPHRSVRPHFQRMQKGPEPKPRAFVSPCVHSSDSVIPT
jgi:hypothetical protein